MPIYLPQLNLLPLMMWPEVLYTYDANDDNEKDTF